jgi:hypothetical protein
MEIVVHIGNLYGIVTFFLVVIILFRPKRKSICETIKAIYFKFIFLGCVPIEIFAHEDGSTIIKFRIAHFVNDFNEGIKLQKTKDKRIWKRKFL